MQKTFKKCQDLKNATEVDTWNFAKKVDLASLKSEVGKLEKIPTGLNSLKIKVYKLDVKLVPVPVDLRKLSDVVKILLKRLNIMNWLKKLTLFKLLILGI